MEGCSGQLKCWLSEEYIGIKFSILEARDENYRFSAKILM